MCQPLWDTLYKHSLEGVMVVLDFKLCSFGVLAKSSESPYKNKALPFSCPVVLFRLIERPVPLTDRSPLIHTAVVLLLEEDSSKFICRCIGISHIWSVWLQKSQYWRFDRLRFQFIQSILCFSRRLRPI